MVTSLRELISLAESGERWLSSAEATELVRERLGITIGGAGAALKQARNSGAVRFFDAEGLLGVTYSFDDLIDWLDRNYPGAPRRPEQRRAAEKADRKRLGGVKRASADRAVKALWDGPPPDHMTPTEIVDQVARELKAQKITNVGRDTILRAAGRKQ